MNLFLHIQAAPERNRSIAPQTVACRWVLGMMALLLISRASPAQSNEMRDVESPYGNHYILLLDDSRDMGKEKGELLRKLPALLFNGKPSPHQSEPQLPGFRPGRDQLSVVYFAIHNMGYNPPCATELKKKSALPNHVFDWQIVTDEQVKTPQAFTDALKGWLSEPCRYEGYLSPIATAQPLVLPYLESRLLGDKPFDRTFLILATNGRSNSKFSPASELIQYRDQFGVSDTDTAEKLIYEVSNLFYLKTPLSWNQPDNDKEVSLVLVSEILPTLSPEVVSYQSPAHLDLQAVSREQLRVTLKNQQGNDLQILLNREAPKFEPVILYLHFQGAKGQPWKLGQTVLPDHPLPIDLRGCQPPQCVSQNDALGIALFNQGGQELLIAPDDPEPGSGTIEFMVGFRYQAGIYNHLYAKTRLHTIDVQAVDALKYPSFIKFFPEKTIAKDDLTDKWDRDDPITTQEMAKNRIIADRSTKWLWICLTIAVLIFYLYQTAYHRPFRPRLQWEPVAKVPVDLNNRGASRLLVGSLSVINNENAPIFGRWLGFDEQPARQAKFRLDYNFSGSNGFKLAAPKPIGFVNEVTAPEQVCGLDQHAQEIISDGKRIHLFLATETIADYEASSLAAGAAEAEFDFQMAMQMDWEPRNRLGKKQGWLVGHLPVWLFKAIQVLLKIDEGGSYPQQLPCKLLILPEAPCKPRVTFEPLTERLEFKKREAVPIGKFIFHSQAEHAFAQMFKSGEYTLRTEKEGRPVDGEPIKLRRNRAMVPPGDKDEIEVYFDCASESLTNPEPASSTYTFRLVGDYDPRFPLESQDATLYRDSTQATIELQITYPEPVREIYWSPSYWDKQAILEECVILESGFRAEEKAVESSTIKLPPQDSIGFSAGSGSFDLVAIAVGNSGTAGKGVVEVSLSKRIDPDEAVRGKIHMKEGQALDDLLEINDENGENRPIRVYETGGQKKGRTIKIVPERIAKIDGSRIHSDQLRAEIKLDISVRDDQGNQHSRELTLIVPLELEQLPGNNLLCIDFGTSAIAAAWGTGEVDGIEIIPLQESKVSQQPGRQLFSEQDENNFERGTPFLPSYIICNADIRTPIDDTLLPGFPEYYPSPKEADSRLTPGESYFIGLPALTYHFENHPDRIIYSLKSWLATSSTDILLGTEVPFEKNGDPRRSNRLPLDDLIVSGLAALADAYLLPKPEYHADQIVLCHPNTFTAHQKERLHKIAFKALGRRFKIDLPERIHLISESEAVAYYYCSQFAREDSRLSTERILVYDFGAGTLDLSLVSVVWNEAMTSPEKWTVENLGVPVAGNYIDELLARIIDDLLRKPEILGAPNFAYQYPVVGFELRGHNPDEVFDHKKAVIKLWEDIRQAKHTWDGNQPFKVRVGNIGSQKGLVVSKSVLEKLSCLPPEADQPGVWVDAVEKEGNIYLSIPSSFINEDERMREFMRFVTRTVLDEMLEIAKLQPADVHTVLVSGRGALWPGLQKKIWGKFPHAKRPDLSKAGTMKDAVVRGAIARQDLNRKLDEGGYRERRHARLGVVLNNDQKVEFEEDWGKKPINLENSPKFWLAQVNLKNPNPREDLRPSSLRRHFYISLTEKLKREEMWKDNKLFVEKSEESGLVEIYLKNSKGRRKTISPGEGSKGIIVKPPWPIGGVLLKPEKQSDATERNAEP